MRSGFPNGARVSRFRRRARRRRDTWAVRSRRSSFPSPHELQFTDQNNDNHRYAYALRCIVMPGEPPVVDDPVIINKIGIGSLTC